MFVCGCSKSTDEKVETQKEQKADFSEKEKSKEADTETKEDSIEESIVSEENINAYQNSSSENDTDLGLKNIKVDYAQRELSEEQKQIVWKVDAKEKISLISTIQEVDGKLIIQVVNNENMEYNEFEGELTGSNEYYYVIDRQDGTLIHEGTVDSVEFHQYS